MRKLRPPNGSNLPRAQIWLTPDVAIIPSHPEPRSVVHRDSNSMEIQKKEFEEGYSSVYWRGFMLIRLKPW